jgi:hypothetical protein
MRSSKGVRDAGNKKEMRRKVVFAWGDWRYFEPEFTKP